MNPGLAGGWSHVLLLRLLGDLCVEDGSAWDVLRSEPLMGVSFVTLLWCTALPSAVAFAVAAAAHVLKKVLVMPEGLDNNGTYLLLVMINFLYGSADQLLLSGSATTSGTTSVAEPDGVLSPIDEAAAAARALTLALYFFAAFAKLNTGFMLHTNFSAATMGLVQLLKLAPDGAWPSRPSPRAQQMTRGLLLANKLAVLGIEWGVPLLLLMQSRHAIVVALLMHYAMGLAGFWVFSVVMQGAVVLLFAPRASAALMQSLLQSPLWQVVVPAATGFLLLAHNNPAYRLPRRVADAVRPLRLRATLLPGESGCYTMVVWAVWSSFQLAACFALPLELEPGLPWLPLTSFGWASLGVAVTLGCVPYLGGRTHASWTMFSNLRLEGGTTNHFLCTERMQCLKWLRDTCVVVSSTDLDIAHFTLGVDAMDGAGPNLTALLGAACGLRARQLGVWWNSNFYGGGNELLTMLPYAVPYVQLRRMVSRKCVAGESFSVRYKHQGIARVFKSVGGVPDASSDAQLSAELPWLGKKLLLFRSFDPDDSRPVIMDT